MGRQQGSCESNSNGIQRRSVNVYWSVTCIVVCKDELVAVDAVNYTYRKTSVRSQVPDRRRAPHTGRGSDTLVLIEARPQIDARSFIQG